VHTCGERELGETCNCSEGVGVEDSGVGGAIVGVMTETLCPVAEVSGVAFVMIVEDFVFGVIVGVGCVTGVEVMGSVFGVL
jgi:hypothetical protein